MGFQKGSIKHLQKRNPAKFGSLEGVKLFSRYENRSELYIEGVHGLTEGGIHGRRGEGAFSVVLSGRYDDDQDKGDIIVYTGEGGHSRDSELQIGDQEWVRGNAALRMSYTRKMPLRVIRSAKLRSKYAPSEGYRYDGLYRVTEAEQVVGKGGHAVCQFILTRLPNQEPLPERTGRAPGQHGPRKIIPSKTAAVPAASSAEKPKPKVSRTGKKVVYAGGIQFKFEGDRSPVKPSRLASLDGSSAPVEFSSRRPLPGL